METIWLPDLSPRAPRDGSNGARAAPLYRAIAAALAEDIRAERLAAGTRLPAMRDLAERLQVTLGTVHRAYALAEKQGLITRQLGRGSYVRAERPAAPARAAASPDGTVDLSRNEPVGMELGPILQRTLAEMAREPDLEGMLDYGFSQGQPRHREILARWIGARGLAAAPERLIVTSGAQQALTIALGALTRAGDTLMVEALTYPGIKNLARLFGLRLRPIPMDGDGLDPAAVAAACRAAKEDHDRDHDRGGGVRLLYCMPNVHNPTTASLSLERRRALAEIAAAEGLVILEDDVFPRRPPASAARGADGQDAPLPALAEIAPESTVYISSLSKTLAPGLRVGAIAAPARLHADLVAVTQTTSWMAPPLMAELACRWIEDGTAAELELARDRVTRELHEVARAGLGALPYAHEPHNNHLWLPLEAPWTGSEFAAKASERRILVAPAEDFAIDPSRAPAAVRLCLPNIDREVLRRALEDLAALTQDRPGPVEFRM
ncbi:MAG: PLP-dependent aminotransferase family protein [Rhodospirillales bacterium]|nr:PLP-dependent aminotransferase family protein [Rhodospirillales bacterium]